MLIEAIATKLQQKLGNMATIALRLTPGLGSLAVAQVEGEGDEASRAGIRFHVQASAGVTGIAPVQALPTVAAQFMFYNPANSGVNVYIDRVGEWLLSGTAGAGGTVLAAYCTAAQLPATRPAMAAGVVIQNANPASKRGAALVVASGVTLLVAPSWSPIAFMNPANTLLGQTQMINEDVRGKIILAPDTGLALAVISPTGTTPLFVPCGSVREYAADNE